MKNLNCQNLAQNLWDGLLDTLEQPCSTRDEGGPLEAGVQAQASNHRKLRRLRAEVVSVAEKAGQDSVR